MIPGMINPTLFLALSNKYSFACSLNLYPVEDFDFNMLQGIKLGDNRVFKLLSNLVSMLSANKNIVVEEPVTSAEASISDDGQSKVLDDETVEPVELVSVEISEGSAYFDLNEEEKNILIICIFV